MNLRAVGCVLALLASASCSTAPPVPERPGESSVSLSSRQGADIQRDLSASARSLIGRRTIHVGGRTFNPDCVGVILGIYWDSGIDLTSAFNRFRGNGVSRLYQALDEAGLLTEEPEAGDLIFWDNTYDRNGNGAWDDNLTHVGFVLETDDKGTINYVHYHYSKGVVKATMNLTYPDTWRQKDIVINSPLRMKGSGNPDSSRWLSSQLFRAFGRAWLP